MPFARPHRRTHAFTLLELLAVMAILVILSGFAFGLVRGANQRAKLARVRAELSHLAQALEEYKRYYGDYPQTGPSAGQSHRVTGTSGPGQTTAQARLFNALVGVYGPANFTARLNGPILVQVSKLVTEVAVSPTTFAVPTGTPPTKTPTGNAFLDPWGNRYMYFYRVAGSRPTTWTPPSYVLFSCGPDGASTAMPSAAGIYSGQLQTTGDNADNIYADKLP